MDYPQLFLDRVPIGRGPPLDRKIAVVHVGEPDNLRAIIRIQIRLFCRYPIEMSGFDLGEHVCEDRVIGFENHDAGVEVEREASVVCEDVRSGGEDEGEFEELVKVASDVGVRVEIDGSLDANLIERPDL